MKSQIALSVPTGYPVIVAENGYTSATYHGLYSGTPTMTGAATAPATLAALVKPKPPNPTATYYNSAGVPLDPMPAPYVPAGGLGTNNTEPRYMVKSDWDFESIALGVYQEYIELDLFHDGLARFTDEEFTAAGLVPEARSLIEFMANQETGHARQQAIFRQMSGLTPIDVWFENGWPQSWQWTMLAPYMGYCPEGQTRLAWQNFPTLRILNNPNINRISPNSRSLDGSETVGRRITDPSVSDITADNSCLNATRTGQGCGPGIAHNRSEPLSFPGKKALFEWGAPGKAVGPNNSYVISTAAGQPQFVGWSNQLNLTYSPSTITGVNTGYTIQPEGYVYDRQGIINGMAVMLTDLDLYVTPFNLTTLTLILWL
ncbi:hypothetical protein BDW62DRAFT_219885 [Aspergillus aurantiobrunneus]